LPNGIACLATSGAQSPDPLRLLSAWFIVLASRVAFGDRTAAASSA